MRLKSDIFSSLVIIALCVLFYNCIVSFIGRTAAQIAAAARDCDSLTARVVIKSYCFYVIDGLYCEVARCAVANDQIALNAFVNCS